MHETLPDIQTWLDHGETVLLATVVKTWGSSPRLPGSMMAFTTSGKVTGSVSGGCVETAVIEEGLDAHRRGQPVMLHYGVGDDTAMEVGLACGGQIDVYIIHLTKDLMLELLPSLLQQVPVTLVTVLGGPAQFLGGRAVFTPSGVSASSLDSALAEHARLLAVESLESGEPVRKLAVQAQQTVELLALPVMPLPTIVMVGGAHISVALALLAKNAGFQTVLIDPRRTFATSERFPAVDRLIPAWPQEAFKQVRLDQSTAVVMLTHDPKIDDPALEAALNSPAFYIGALGSRKTQQERRQRMLALGFTSRQLERIHGPVGIDIGARLPEEIAVSILAEIIAVRRGKV